MVQAKPYIIPPQPHFKVSSTMHLCLLRLTCGYYVSVHQYPITCRCGVCSTLKVWMKHLPSSETPVALISCSLYTGKQPTTPAGEMKNAELEDFTLDIRLLLYWVFLTKWKGNALRGGHVCLFTTLYQHLACRSGLTFRHGTISQGPDNGLRAGRPVFDSRQGQDSLLLHIVKTLSVVHPVSCPVTSVVLPPVVKLQGREADHSSPSSGKR
jgi:hypothetical protein